MTNIINICKEKKIVAVFVLWILLMISGGIFLSGKITFLETVWNGPRPNAYVTLDKIGASAEQKVKIPFERVEYISLYISDYGRDSNSKWQLSMLDKKGNVVANKIFSLIGETDCDYYKIKFDHPVKVHKGEDYLLVLKGIEVEDGSKIALGFDEITEPEGVIIGNGEEYNGQLSLCVAGGDSDHWWVVIYFVFITLLMFIFGRAIWLKKSGIRFEDDILLLSLITGMITFIVFLPFASFGNNPNHCDEVDNIVGGMVISKGGVLYRDYVVQHPPVAYYLSALYSLFGAKSVPQFRIMMFITIGIIAGSMFHRHNKTYGKFVMTALFPTLSLCLFLIVGPMSAQLLSDPLQGIGCSVLLLEMESYYRDPEKKLDIQRCIWISAGILLSIGCAFVSIFSLFFFGLRFLYNEFIIFKVQKKPVLLRYIKLLTVILIPYAVFIILFKIKHALYEAYRQIYVFNREVYPVYDQFGNSLLSPFISGTVNTFNLFRDCLFRFLGHDDIKAVDVFLFVCVPALLYRLIRQIKKDKAKIIPEVLLILGIFAGATREVSGQHSQAFWFMLLTYIIVFVIPESVYVFREKNTIRNITLMLVLILLIQLYIKSLNTAVSYELQPADYLESTVIHNTDPDEGVFIDLKCKSTVYLAANGRMPVNRAAFYLPWYMDWYENWNIEDLVNKQPKYIIWDPEQEANDKTHYAPRLEDYIRSNYTQDNIDPKLWIMNE